MDFFLFFYFFVLLLIQTQVHVKFMYVIFQVVRVRLKFESISLFLIIIKYMQSQSLVLHNITFSCTFFLSFFYTQNFTAIQQSFKLQSASNWQKVREKSVLKGQSVSLTLRFESDDTGGDPSNVAKLTEMNSVDL